MRPAGPPFVNVGVSGLEYPSRLSESGLEFSSECKTMNFVKWSLESFILRKLDRASVRTLFKDRSEVLLCLEPM